MEQTTQSMLGVLGADGPSAEHASELMLYGRFVGAWDGTVVVYRKDGSRREEECEVYFGWVLEGRAIQDVWIAPARSARADPARPAKGDIYGTTIRMYDPDEDAWRVTWIEPNTSSYSQMVGRKQGDDIVQEYRDDDGTLWQWSFTDIADESFRWLAKESNDDGETWELRNEFLLKRR